MSLVQVSDDNYLITRVILNRKASLLFLFTSETQTLKHLIKMKPLSRERCYQQENFIFTEFLFATCFRLMVRVTRRLSCYWDRWGHCIQPIGQLLISQAGCDPQSWTSQPSVLSSPRQHPMPRWLHPGNHAPCCLQHPIPKWHPLAQQQIALGRIRRHLFQQKGQLVSSLKRPVSQCWPVIAI